MKASNAMEYYTQRPRCTRVRVREGNYDEGLLLAGLEMVSKKKKSVSNYRKVQELR